MKFSMQHAAYSIQHSAVRRLRVLGVDITDVTRPRAIELLEEMIRQYRRRDPRDQRFASPTTSGGVWHPHIPPSSPAERCPVGTRPVFFANAHTLNLAAADRGYRQVLRAADHVFGDGTGVRWACYLKGVTVRDNLVGTDLVPALFRETAGGGYRYFLLGSDQQTVCRAASYAQRTFPGWGQAGYHHGYLATPELTARVIRQINLARPDLLLVGMGNPRQERWILDHQYELKVPVSMAVGGLFDYWAGNVSRAPQWLRNLGHEWLWRLGQQPKDKAKRYLVGNPVFLARILREAWASRRQ
jgi:N-acetylglucosaminyldiphosphoundecaprenol N-acetyl-beta-D-mannosaminyltransferase